MQSVRLPFPCAVYTRIGSGGRYTFSHCCSQQAVKSLPRSLRASDLREFDPEQNWANLGRACFLVLVAGDVAQCVSLNTAHDAKRIQFLYTGSAFAQAAPGLSVQHSELSEAYIPLHFHGTMAVFDRFNGIRAVIPIESGIALFPRTILDTDVRLLSRWVSHCARRSLHASVLVTESGDSYNEVSLQLNARRLAKQEVVI